MASGWVRRADLEGAQRERDLLRNQVEGLERQTLHLHQALERERELNQRVQERIDNLVDKIVEMKREGFTPAPFAHPGELEKLDLDLDQAIIDAIADQSQGIPDLQRKLTRFALSAMREEGATVGAVRKAILNGGSPYDEEEEL